MKEGYSVKERLLNKADEAFRSFFIIVTLINLAMFVLGRIFQPDMKFGYEAFIYPVIYGLITSLPHLITGDERQMSIRQVVIQKIIQLLLILAILLTFMYCGNDNRAVTLPVMAAVAVSVVIIYIAVQLIIWQFDRNTAVKMTQELRNFQEKEGCLQE